MNLYLSKYKFSHIFGKTNFYYETHCSMYYFSKHITKNTFIILVFIALYSCSGDFEIKIDAPDKIAVNEPLHIKIIEHNTSIDALTYFIDDIIILDSSKNDLASMINGSVPISIVDFKLGKHKIKVKASIGKVDKTFSKTIYFFADKKPKMFDFKIINTFPHDSKAYTQGLFYHQDFLYEGTGRFGNSSLRKVELETGKVLQKIDLDKKYFGEGIALFNDEIHHLTWRSGKGFVYDFNSFDLKKEFDYQQSKEGWGLTNNDQFLIKSDGTERIWFVDPSTHQEVDYIEIYTNKRKVAKLNELEYINGLIYANVWQQNAIVMINPKNGRVEGVLDLSRLIKIIQKEQKINKKDNVLNGIAYDQKNDRLFVTGKNWNKLFEIKLEESIKE